MAVAVLAGYDKSNRFYSNFFALLNVDRFEFETATLDPALVHSKQHVGPIARFSPAGAGMNCHKRICAIVFAREKLAELEIVEFVSKKVVFRKHFLLRLRAMGRIAFPRSEFLQRAEILDL